MSPAEAGGRVCWGSIDRMGLPRLSFSLFSLHLERRHEKRGLANLTGKLSPAVSLSLSFAATFACVGIGLPYGPVWFADRGLSVIEIGYLSSLGSMAKLIASGPFGNIADRFGKPGLMVAVAVAVGLAGHVGYLLSGAFWQYAAIAILVGMFFPGALSVLESAASRQAALGRFDYGRVRLWGSVGFLATSLLAGALLRWVDPWIIMPLIVGCFALALIVAIAAPIGDSGEPRPPRASLWLHSLTILKSPGVAWVFLAAGCIQNSHMMYYSYSVLHWRSVGMESTLTGLLWGLSIIGEIGLLMIAGGWLMRVPPAWLMLAGGLSAAFRWSVMAVTSDSWAMVGCQLLHAPSFALTHLATMRFFGDRAPAGLAATTQGLFMALPMGLATMAAFAGSGLLYQAFGGGGFWAMAALALAGSLACLKLRV